VNLTAKHPSNREIQQRKVDLVCKTSIQHKNTTKISRSVSKKNHPTKKYNKKTLLNMLEHEKMQKNCYLFGVTHCAHESQSKNSIQPRNKV